MNVRTQWPWISMVLTVVIALNPLGIDVVTAAFFSNEALSRNIWAPMALTGMAIMVLIAVLEWRIRKFIIRRRACGTATLS